MFPIQQETLNILSFSALLSSFTQTEINTLHPTSPLWGWKLYNALKFKHYLLSAKSDEAPENSIWADTIKKKAKHQNKTNKKMRQAAAN